MKVDATIYLIFDIDDRDADQAARMLVDRMVDSIEGIYNGYNTRAWCGDIEESELTNPHTGSIGG